MEIEERKLRRMLDAAAELGAITALKKAGIMTNDEISQREAYRRFGEAKVKYWKHTGRLQIIKSKPGNSKVTYSLKELETLHHIEKI